ncbi:MAG: glycosyltransferase [Gracilimonas sp.]
MYYYLKFHNIEVHDSHPVSEKQRPDNVKALTKKNLLSFFTKPDDLIHYHSTSIRMRIFLGFVALINPNVYIHIHGASLVDQIKKNDFKSKLLKLLLPRLNVISSNPEIASYIQSRLTIRSHHYYDAFIPPLYKQEVVDKVLRSVSWPDSKYVISMGGWFASYNSEDLYGFDIMLQTLHMLRAKGLDISVVASVNGIKDKQLYWSFLEERDALSLNQHFQLIMEDLPELYPVLIESDLFVRPTNTDGNAVSIKEALWFEVPVLASDVVSRPQKTFTFKNRDVDDLARCIEEVLENYTKERSTFHSEKKFKHPMIKEIYGFK